ncbi:MAG: 7TM diverse intracellular signaling domain-containing protein, partial [Flavobacteriales bacterium]
EQYVLDIDNPHIDRIEAYRISNGEFDYLGQSGDRIAFNKRTEENRRNVFHVHFEKATDTLLIMADKRNASVSVPLKLWKYDEFQRYESKSNMIYGLYFGMLLLIVFYSVLIFGIQRSSIYLWYGFYVVCFFMYLFVYVGYGFQFIFPEQYEWSNYLRLVMMVLIVIAQIRFTQLFLPVKSASALLNKFYYVVIATLVAIICWWILVPGLFTTYTIIVINVVFCIIGVALLALVFTLFRCWKLGRTSVLFYGVAFGTNVVSAFTMMGEEYGLYTLAFLPVPPLFIGSFLEILIFAIGLSYRSKLIGDDRKRLLDNINSLQQQAMSAFLKGVEEEKVRVANELHDDVAARLSLLKLKVENVDENELKEQITAITNEVRGISHRLNPVSLDENTFLEKVRQLVDEHKATGLKINLQVFDVPAEMRKDLGLQLYRIFQEAMTNIQRHAKAQEIDVQFFGHENNLILTVEDDGVGFDQEKNR